MELLGNFITIYIYGALYNYLLIKSYDISGKWVHTISWILSPR